MIEYRIMVGYTSDTMQALPASGAYDAFASTLQKLARDKAAASKAKFTFPFDQVGMPDIRELNQLWAGWFNTDANSWLQEPDPPFLGYIMASRGGQEGGEHVIFADINGLQCLTPRCTVIGWPTGEDTGIATAGMPLGLSVTDWLIGTAGTGGMPEDGVIRYYCPNLDYTGIAPYFDSLILTADVLPGGNVGEHAINPATREIIVGQWGMTDLETILQDVVGAARYAAAIRGESIEPLYFFDAVADGSRLRPRFRLIDNLDTAGPVKGRFSTAPGVGDFPLRDAWHSRDARQVVTDVAITAGTGDGAGHLIMSRYQAHNSDYPAEYLRNGWGGKPRVETKIRDQAECDRVAAAVGSRVWGAIGTLTTRTRGTPVGTTDRVQFGPGDIILWDDPAEGQADHPYIVRGADPVEGSPTETVLTVGDIAPDATDIIRGATIVRPLRGGGRGAGGGTSGAGLGAYGLPGAPTDLPVARYPIAPGQSVAQGLRPDVPALTTRPPAQVAGQPPVLTLAPQIRAQYYDAGSGTYKDGFNISGADGRPHPNALHAGTFITDASFKLTFPVYQIQVTAIDLEGTGSVVLLKDSVPVSGTLTGPGRFPISPAVIYNPRIGATPAEWIGITTSGTSSGDPMGVVIWEA